MSNGQHIQQTLGGVCVTTVPCVDHMHMGRNVLRDQLRRTRFAVTHHKNIGRHGTQIGNGV